MPIAPTATARANPSTHLADPSPRQKALAALVYPRHRPYEAYVHQSEAARILEVCRRRCPESARNMSDAYRALATRLCRRHLAEPLSRDRFRALLAEAILATRGRQASERMLDRAQSVYEEAGVIRVQRVGGLRSQVIGVSCEQVLRNNGGAMGQAAVAEAQRTEWAAAKRRQAGDSCALASFFATKVDTPSPPEEAADESASVRHAWRTGSDQKCQNLDLLADSVHPPKNSRVIEACSGAPQPGPVAPRPAPPPASKAQKNYIKNYPPPATQAPDAFTDGLDRIAGLMSLPPLPEHLGGTPAVEAPRAPVPLGGGSVKCLVKPEEKAEKPKIKTSPRGEPSEVSAPKVAAAVPPRPPRPPHPDRPWEALLHPETRPEWARRDAPPKPTGAILCPPRVCPDPPRPREEACLGPHRRMSAEARLDAKRSKDAVARREALQGPHAPSPNADADLARRWTTPTHAFEAVDELLHRKATAAEGEAAIGTRAWEAIIGVQPWEAWLAGKPEDAVGRCYDAFRSYRERIRAEEAALELPEGVPTTAVDFIRDLERRFAAHRPEGINGQAFLALGLSTPAYLHAVAGAKASLARGRIRGGRQLANYLLGCAQRRAMGHGPPSFRDDDQAAGPEA